MDKAGMESCVYVDARDEFIKTLTDVKNPEVDIAKRLEFDLTFNMILMYLRFRISATIQTKNDIFGFYFESLKDR